MDSTKAHQKIRSYGEPTRLYLARFEGRNEISHKEFRVMASRGNLGQPVVSWLQLIGVLRRSKQPNRPPTWMLDLDLFRRLVEAEPGGETGQVALCLPDLSRPRRRRWVVPPQAVKPVGLSSAEVDALLGRLFPGEFVHGYTERALDYEGLEDLGDVEVVQVDGVMVALAGDPPRPNAMGVDGEDAALCYAEGVEPSLGHELNIETWEYLVVVPTEQILRWDLQTHRLCCVERSVRRWEEHPFGGFSCCGDWFRVWTDQYGEWESLRNNPNTDPKCAEYRVRTGLHWALVEDVVG